MKPFTLNIAGKLHNIDTPLVMGILNVTPDSFYSPSRMDGDEAKIERQICTFIDEGADIIDIGACSTRPGAEEVSEEVEIRRLRLATKILRSISPEVWVSVDTFRANVARIAVEELGCNIVNDISCANFDPDMIPTVARLRVPYILMHSRGSGMTQIHSVENAAYEDPTADVLRELDARIQTFELAGVSDVIVDPGIGFSKTLEQNYSVLAELKMFETLHRPILVGVSRKSLITKMLGIESEEALAATTALNAYCLDRGASILRVHDVRPARQAVEIYNRLTNPNIS